MLQTSNRRQILLSAATAVSGAAIGCGSSTVTQGPVETANDVIDDLEEAVSDASNEELKQYKLALRGYQIVSLHLAGRTVFLPYPGMRILSVMLVVTSVAAKLAVEYIDDELILRKIEESLTDRERTMIETDGYVTFKTESGLTEKVYLAPADYAGGE